MSYKQEDNLDLETYVDFDQGVLSPSSSNKGKQPIRTPEVLSQPQQHQFSGPSHQYDNYTQQTGLPAGALQNALAANKNTAFHLGGYSNTFGGSSGVEFDFNAIIPQQPFDSTADMDLDFNPPMDGFYNSGSGFVDPNVIGGQEDASPPPQPPMRMWPGMHTRNAELAKQQQQQEIQRQQQIKTGQQSQGQASGHKRNSSKASNGPARADPVVEERISRLLNQMRHGSVSSASNDEKSSQSNQAQQSQRSQKHEEDMDEDERLLASEEGKKLSSKERRQLRNKVSARAFRSRRKEYISQLEGEIALKGQENEDLRAENDQLRQENNRLTDLSKMLLSSPAFSTFLNDLSASGMTTLPAQLTQQPTSQPQLQAQQQQSQAPKDANPNRHQLQLQQQDGVQIGMTLLPEGNNNMDFMAPSNGNWNNGMDFNFNEPQVYAVTELPEGPVPQSLDTSIFSGKSSNIFENANAKDNAPVIGAMPKPEVAVSSPKVEEAEAPIIDESVEFDESDPAFALFVDCEPAKSSSEPSEVENNVFGDIPLSKAVARFDMMIEGEEASSTGVSTAVMAKFEAICSRLEASSSRLSDLFERL